MTFDRIEQAPEGGGYNRETVDNRDDAIELVHCWQEQYGEDDGN